MRTNITCVVSIEDPEGDGGQDAGEVEEDGGREGLLQGLQGRGHRGGGPTIYFKTKAHQCFK
jgi:hypothetical protein